MLDLLIFSVFVLLMFLTPLLGIIKYEGLHGIIYRVSKLNTVTDGAKVIFTIFNIFRVYKPLKFYSAFFLMFSILSLTAAYPVIDDWIVHRYVYHVPLAILSTGLGIIAILSLSLGLILDAITQQYNVNYEHKLLNTSINKE